MNYHRVDVDKNNVTPNKNRALGIASRVEPLTKRRVNYISPDDPAHPGKSLRKGNVKYTFTKPQLGSVHSVLNELRGRYLGDYSLVIILTGYIDEISDF